MRARPPNPGSGGRDPESSLEECRRSETVPARNVITSAPGPSAILHTMSDRNLKKSFRFPRTQGWTMSLVHEVTSFNLWNSWDIARIWLSNSNTRWSLCAMFYHIFCTDQSLEMVDNVPLVREVTNLMEIITEYIARTFSFWSLPSIDPLWLRDSFRCPIFWLSESISRL